MISKLEEENVHEYAQTLAKHFDLGQQKSRNYRNLVAEVEYISQRERLVA